MTQYQLQYRKIGLWLVVLGAVLGAAFFLQSSGSEQGTLTVDYSENVDAGETVEVRVEDASTGEPVQGANVFVNGVGEGSTGQNGELEFTAPSSDFDLSVAQEGYESSSQQVPVEESSENDSNGDQNGTDNSSNSDNSNDSENSDNNQDEENNGSNNSDENNETPGDPELNIGFTPPEVGQTNYAELLDENGEPVEGENISLNGEEIGLTDENGRVNFNVPNSQEITMSTSYEGLEIDESVDGYEAQNEDDNSTDNNQDSGENSPHGIQLDSDPVSNTNNRVILYDNGDRISGETVYLDGNELGQTGSNGAIEFSIPLQDQITISTDYSLEDQVFNVQENHPEPEIILLSPDSGDSFDTTAGETTDIDFKASVEITENSGTAKLMIDGSEAYTQELSQGENTVSTTQGLSSGSHSWSIEIDTEEFNINSNSRALTVSEEEVQNGLSLRNNATAGEYNYVTLYGDNEPVEGAEITVNGESIGSTDADGEVGFEVPNVQEIAVSASGYSEITQTVEGYEEVNTPLINSATIQNPSPGKVQKPFTFEANVDSGLADSYEIKNNNQVFSSGSLTENSTNTISENISPPNGEQTLEFVVTNSQNGNSSSRSVTVDVWDNINIIEPSEPDDFVIDYEFNILHDKSGQYDVLLDDRIIDSGFKESDESAFSKDDLVVFNSGDHDFWVEFESESGERIESNKVEFRTEQDASPVSVNTVFPKEGSLVDRQTGINQTGFEMQYETFFPVNHYAIIYVDEEKIVEREEFKNGTHTYAAPLSTGVHDYRIVLKNEINSSIKRETATNTFYLVPYSLDRPQEGNTYSQSMSVEFSADVQSTADYYMYIDSGQVASGTVGAGEDISEQLDLQSGQHTFELGLSPESTNEIFKTEKITFSVS